MSTGDDFMHSSEMIFLVPFLDFKEALALLVNDSIMSGDGYGHLDTFYIKICPLFHI